MSFPKSIRTAWVATSVAPQGTNTANLTPYQVGLFNENHVAFTNSTFQANRNIRFAVGSPNTGQKGVTGKLGNFPNINNVDISFKSQHVFGHNIDRVWVSKPVKTAKPFIGYIGFDDQNFTKNLFITPGKQYALEVVVKGQPVRAIFGQDIRESFEIDGGCIGTATTFAGVTPTNGLAVLDGTTAQNAAGLVINDLIRRLGDGYITSRFFKAEKVISNDAGNAVSHPGAGSYPLYAHTLTVSDTGDSLALAAVKNQFSSYTIERDSRIGNTSVYRLLTNANNLTPSPFTQDNVYLFDCPTGTCATGYVLNYGYSLFNVSRSLGGTTLNSTMQQAVANSVFASYNTPITFDGQSSSRVVISATANADYFNITNHGLYSGQKVQYALGTGGSVIAGLSVGTDYFVFRVDADNFKLAANLADLRAGTFVNITAVGTGTVHYIVPASSRAANAGGYITVGAGGMDTTDIVTTATHNLTTGDAVFYAPGNAAQALRVTALDGSASVALPAGVYFVSVLSTTTFKLAYTVENLINGNFIDITTASTGTNISFVTLTAGTIVSEDNSTMTVSIRKDKSVTSLTPVGTDNVVFEGVVKDYCSLSALISTSWSAVSTIAGRAIKVYTLTKKLDDCNSPSTTAELAALQAAYPTSLTIQAAPTVSSTNGCNVTYTMTVYSRPMDLDCDTTLTPVFDAPAAWKGFQWVGGDETPNALVGNDNASSTKYGIKFTGAFVDQRTGGCSFDPKDAVTYDPIQLEVSLYEVTHDAAFGQTTALINSSSTCTPYVADWTVTQYPTREELLGQSVLRDVIKSRRYNQELYVSPSEELGGKFTKAEGLEYGVDVDAYYYAVHILHNVKKRVNNTASEPEQREEVVVYFPETNYTAMIQFVNALDTYTSSAGIFMNPITL